MTDTPEAVPAHSMFKVLAALAALGEATAAAVAEHAGLGYSTATAKLRAWEQTGQAERFRTDDGRTLWRLTETGRTATAAVHPDSGQPPAAPETATPAGPDQAADERTRRGDVSDPTGPPPAVSDNDQTMAPGADTGAPAAPAVPSVAADGQDLPVQATPDETPRGTPQTDSTRPARQDTSRRAKGSLRGAVLDILEAHPDRAYKTGELCKLIDDANGGDAAKASAGAVYNAAIKLVASGRAVQTVERPATFQLAGSSGGE